MPYAARPLATPDAAWVQPGDQAESIGAIECSQAWLAGLPDEDVAEHGLQRAEVAGRAPVPGLGHPPALEDVDGVPTWAWSLEGVESLRACRVSEVKAEARQRILAVLDKDQQDNALALGQEMIYTHGPDPAGWPEPEKATYAAVMAKWAQIKAIRTASDAIEAALPTDAETLADFVAGAAEGWPV